MTILFPGVQESTVPSTTVTNYGPKSNASIQEVATTSITYLADTKLAVPNGGLPNGAKFDFDFVATKTGAGTATATVAVLAGPNGDVTDTVIATFTKPAGTADAASAHFKLKGDVISQYSTTQVPYMSQAVLDVISSKSTQGVIALQAVSLDAIATLSTTQVAAIEAAQFVGVAVTLGASDDYTFSSIDAALSRLTTGAPNA